MNDSKAQKAVTTVAAIAVGLGQAGLLGATVLNPILAGATLASALLGPLLRRKRRPDTETRGE